MAETITQLEHKRASYEDYDKITGLLTLEVNFGWRNKACSNGDCVCVAGFIARMAIFCKSLAHKIRALAPEAECAARRSKNRTGQAPGASFSRL